MPAAFRFSRLAALSLILVSLAAQPGCYTRRYCWPPRDDIPGEPAKVSLPPYVIDAPDILLIDAVSVIPKPPYKIEPLDGLVIQATEVLEVDPISAIYRVEPEGTVNLGISYGTVRVAGMTLEEAQAAIEKHLKQLKFKAARVQVALAESRSRQLIRGEHLVRPDGTVGLGTYGSVHVAGLTLAEAKAAIEEQLSQYLLDPEVSVDVLGYNSKVYYIVTDGAGFGEQVYRFPITGNETVLDAISQINGLPPVASKKRIWVVRSTPDSEFLETLPVDWKSITMGGPHATNYQIFPGDRIYVQAEPLITLDTYLARIISPIERVLGVTLLGSGTVNSIKTSGSGGFGTGF